MIKNYLLITYRSMMKNKAFIIINVFGMGIALACCIVSYLAYQYDSDFDTVHKNGEHIYRVSVIRSFENTSTRFGYASLPLGEIMDKTFQDVDHSSLYTDSYSNFKREDDLFASRVSYVEPDFFQMFSFNFIAGSSDAIRDKSNVLISESMAVRLFNSPAEALGKTMTQVYGQELKEVKIAGIFQDPPMNSSFHKQGGLAFMNFENYKDEFPHAPENDWHQLGTLFIQINHTDRKDIVYKQLQPYIKNNNEVQENFQLAEFALDPFLSMAHHDRDEDVRSQTWGAPPVAAIIGSVIMSGLILLIACFNLTNTAIAISSRRLKEIGIRKVMGSVRIQLIIQFIGETTCACLLALIVGVALTNFLVEGWNLMTGNNIHLEVNYFDQPSILFFIIALLIITGIIAGSYPAFYISKFQPVSILKGKLKFGGTNYFTRILLCLQFAISLISIVSAFAFLQNARYQREYDLGFDIRGSLIAPVNNRSEFDTYRNALQNNPEILSIAGAKSSIGSFRMHEAVEHEMKKAEVDIVEAGDDYLKTFNLQLTQGRDFISNSETDMKESVIITENMATLFGLTQPLGKEIVWRDSIRLFVIGVVKDIYTQGLWRDRDALMMRYIPADQYSNIIVNAKAENIASVQDYMQKEWYKIFPNRLYPGRMLSSDLQTVTNLNMSVVYGYTFLGTLALLLSVTGLFSLVSLNIVKRMKEIGVRKILGASVFNISRIINAEFIIILLVASALGAWAGYTWSNTIMSNMWRYYKGVDIYAAAMAVGLLLTICGLTIGYKIYTIATMDPVKTLRDE
ncbi:ABC transporter permease [Ohtaekwangia kribbensis]|jgi:putative ABC transport system permease protein|uniref:ABC transporter permease n=1 Tax=Ohtaekwangia kribbensis TaxID=688913 RepID=A0ABW3K1U1_9BACT